MYKQEIVISTWGGRQFRYCLEVDIGGEDETHMVAVEIHTLRCNVHSAGELLLLVQAPCGAEDKKNYIIPEHTRKQQPELRILCSQLYWIILGV